MCGIVGLLLKKPELHRQLGELMVPMLIGMTDRGPDSAGMAVFTAPLPEGRRKISLFADAPGEGATNGGSSAGHAPAAGSGRSASSGGASGVEDWAALVRDLNAAMPVQATANAQGPHAVLTFDGPAEPVRQWLLAHRPKLHQLSTGRRIDLYKDIGSPAQVAARYDFGKLHGSHLVGHTRMATESAVTPDRAHPFTAGEDFCLVHNGSLSNPNAVRRMLEPRGIHFDTDNDTEAACRFLEWRLREGDDLPAALQKGFEALDGFYTFLMGTADALALIRDPFACKPAVVAETDDYVAIASEFRSLAHLPGVKRAHVFEPAPEKMYVWTL
jgi:amidophosphoribosyltransferase